MTPELAARKDLSFVRIAGACGLALALLCSAAAQAQIRAVEAVGAFPLTPDTRRTEAPRDGAVRLALEEAVRRVALDLVRNPAPGEVAEFLPEVLGGDPLEYTIRFSIIEDRGERPALFGDDPNAALEYVVVVEAHIDVDRLEQRLEDAGLLVAEGGSAPERDLRLVVEDLPSFAAYAALRDTLIEGVGVKSALPVEMERGRVVLVVRTHRDAAQLLEDLLQSAPPELVVTPLAGLEGVLTLRVALEASPPGADSEKGAEIGGAARGD